MFAKAEREIKILSEV